MKEKMLTTRGNRIVDATGKEVRLQGVNLGNWFVQEFWMAVSSVGDFETGIYTTKRGRRAMAQNPNLSQSQIEELEQLYLDCYIQESDFAEIAALGMNTVRIPFTHFNLTTDGATLKEDAFAKLDFAVEMCEKYGLYAILDLHGAVGSQNMDIHSGDDDAWGLYPSQENREKTKQLWRQIAEHYKGNPTVAGYDLLNEPRKKAHRFGGKLNFDFYDELYHVVREVDKEHIIMIECFTFPYHGARMKKYGWENVCIEYHIYNLTCFSMKFCLNFYKWMHKMMGYRTPVLIGEWNAFTKAKDWQTAFSYFERMGWSHCSWCYKANALYLHTVKNYSEWGLFELDFPTVNLATATYEEIAATYKNTITENAKKGNPYFHWQTYLQSKKNRK